MFDNPFSRKGILKIIMKKLRNQTKIDIIAGYEFQCYYYNFSNMSFLINNDFFNSLKIFITYFSVPDNSSYYDFLIFYNISYINPNDY